MGAEARATASEHAPHATTTAYQDNYLNSQLTPFLLPGSETEYDLERIRVIRGEIPGILPEGRMRCFDFVTLHQRADLSVLFYETMDFGIAGNPNLNVKHKSKLYLPQQAGTIFIVGAIDDHPRAPLSPRGERP